MRPLPSSLILALPFPPVFVHQSASCQFFTSECSSPPPTRLNVLHPLQLAFLSFPPLGFCFLWLSSFPFPFCFRVIVLLQLRRIIISSILIIYYKRDVIVLRYASGLFQAYFLCLSLFSPFITKILKGAIFRLKNIFTKPLLPPQKFGALGGRLVRLMVKPALRLWVIGLCPRKFVTSRS